MSAKELNIGDYVRIDDGLITKIKMISNQKWEEPQCVYARVLCEDNEIYEYPKHIKISPNIIDLIEVGDLIKLYSTKQIQQVLAINDEEIDLTDFIFFDLQESKEQFEKGIEWVITHEQIEQLKYKIGE